MDRISQIFNVPSYDELVRLKEDVGDQATEDVEFVWDFNFSFTTNPSIKKQQVSIYNNLYHYNLEHEDPTA